MSASESDRPIEVTKAEERPFVQQYSQKPKFYVGDKVYLLNSNGSREGPYVIASVTSTQKYTLCLENGQAVRGGAEVSASALQAK